MWHDFVTWFNTKVAIVNGWVHDGEKLFYYGLPMAAFVYVVVMVIRKRLGKKQGP